MFDKIIKNAPLIINEEFIKKNKIDLIVHGFFWIILWIRLIYQL